MSQATVYLVDDDLPVLKMLQTMIATIGVEIRAYSSARDFLAAYRPLPCECLVCDLRMPDIDGMELQRQLLERKVALPIIFLTGFAEVGIAVEAMKHGAFDFMEKPFSAQELLGRIKSALEVSRARHAESLNRQAYEARMALLTPKECEVGHHVADGRSSREIAELLGISTRTVESHRVRIMEKLHVESAIKLVKLFDK